MRDGSTEGMQCFDDEIEKLIRAGTIDIETGLSYATNSGNLRLHLADLLEESSDLRSRVASNQAKSEAKESSFAADPELETTL